jgi:prepilin peptidase CpaA
MAGVGVGLAASHASGISLGASIAGFLVGLALMMPGHVLGATGAGDVKFMAAVGAIVGPALVVSAFLFTALAGGVLALAVAIRRRRLSATLAGTGRLIAAPAEARKEMQSAPTSSRFAYGPAIAIGSVLAALIG